MYDIRLAEAFDIIRMQTKGIRFKNVSRSIFIVSKDGVDIGFMEGEPAIMFDNVEVSDEHFMGACEAMIDLNKRSKCRTLIKIGKNNKLKIGILEKICIKVSSRAFRFFEM